MKKYQCNLKNTLHNATTLMLLFNTNGIQQVCEITNILKLSHSTLPHFASGSTEIISELTLLIDFFRVTYFLLIQNLGNSGCVLYRGF